MTGLRFSCVFGQFWIVFCANEAENMKRQTKLTREQKLNSSWSFYPSASLNDFSLLQWVCSDCPACLHRLNNKGPRQRTSRCMYPNPSSRAWPIFGRCTWPRSYAEQCQFCVQLAVSTCKANGICSTCFHNAHHKHHRAQQLVQFFEQIVISAYIRKIQIALMLNLMRFYVGLEGIRN